MTRSVPHAAARQWLEIGRLLGVPFIPVAMEASPSASDDDPATDPAPPASDVGARSAAGEPPPAPPVPRSTPTSSLAPERPGARRGDPPAPAATPAPAPAASARPVGAAVVPLRVDLPADPGEALAALAARYEQVVVPTVTEHRFSRVVFGEGDPRAGLMVVGEGPGAEEDRTGRPFVGPAGRKLEQMLAAMKLQRSEVYIANVVKIRPPGNRTPLAHEVDRCGPWLAAQIRAIRPRVILALGGPAAKWLLRTDLGITRLRGVWAEWIDDGSSEEPPLVVPVLPSFHPAYLLRNYTRETREQMWHDLQAVMARLGAGHDGQAAEALATAADGTSDGSATAGTDR